MKDEQVNELLMKEWKNGKLSEYEEWELEYFYKKKRDILNWEKKYFGDTSEEKRVNNEFGKKHFGNTAEEKNSEYEEWGLEELYNEEKIKKINKQIGEFISKEMDGVSLSTEANWALEGLLNERQQVVNEEKIGKIDKQISELFSRKVALILEDERQNTFGPEHFIQVVNEEKINKQISELFNIKVALILEKERQNIFGSEQKENRRR